MAVTLVVAGNRILASDINQFYNLLKGVAASGESVTLIYNNQALIFQPSSDPSAGTRVVVIKNNSGTTLASWRYDGLLELLSAAAAPASAVAGSIYFDSLLSYLRVYDGTNWRELQTVYPNLVLNSDFGRRTVFGLAMPEVFADTSGYTRIDAGTAPSVSSNILTQGAANNEEAWAAGAFVWRDGRMSATFKATATTGTFILQWRIDASNMLRVYNTSGTFTIDKIVSGSTTSVATVAQAMTLNRWYWLEIEKQGTTIVGKMYDTGGTVPGVTKASSTLLQTLTGTVADAGVQVGATLGIKSDTATAQWGGIATGNGGVYVETWLPESHTFTFAGTLGGQAVGYDEAADSGSLSKQNALRFYIPATSRQLVDNNANTDNNTPDGSVTGSAAYTFSQYVKTSGKAGAGALVTARFYRRNSASTSQGSSDLTDAGETSWTRKTVTVTTEAGTRRSQIAYIIGDGSTTTGTAWVQLAQLEQGSAATAWRNAPADDAPIVWEFSKAADSTTTSATAVEIDARDLAGNLFLPWDANVEVQIEGTVANSGANQSRLGSTIDASLKNGITASSAAAASYGGYGLRIGLGAGKHRIGATFYTAAGTMTFYGTGTAGGNHSVRVTAYRGK